MAKKKEYTKEEIKEFAKELYFEVDTQGQRVYSLNDIATNLLQSCNKKIERSTIMRWAKKENWDGLFIKIKQHGIEQAQITLEQKENEIIQKKGSIHADIQKGHKELYDLLQESILNDVKSDPTIKFEAKVKAFEIATNTLIKLNPIEDNKADQMIEQLINSLDSETIEKLLNKI